MRLKFDCAVEVTVELVAWVEVDCGIEDDNLEAGTHISSLTLIFRFGTVGIDEGIDVGSDMEGDIYNVDIMATTMTTTATITPPPPLVLRLERDAWTMVK